LQWRRRLNERSNPRLSVSAARACGKLAFKLPQCFDFLSIFYCIPMKSAAAEFWRMPRIIDNMTTESDARGSITLHDLQSALDDDEAERIGTILGYWPTLKDNLYAALGLRPMGRWHRIKV